MSSVLSAEGLHEMFGLLADHYGGSIRENPMSFDPDLATHVSRLKMRHGPWVLPGLCIGVSLALPLFLLLRERHLQRL